MSDVIADLKVRVELENAQIKSQIEAIETKFKELGSTVKDQSKKVDSFGDATKKLGGLLAGAAAVGFLKRAGEEAIDNTKSMTLLQRQMEKTLGATDAETQSVLAQIDAMEKMSNVQAEELRPQFDTLLRSTKDSATALDLLNTALNVSAGTGKDLNVVTIGLARAYNGNVASLNKLVPEVKNVKDKMGYLKDEFKGASQAAADKDPYGKLEVTMKNLYEAVGMTLLPVLQELATWFQSTLEFIKPLLPLIEGLAVAFVAYKVGLMGLTLYQTIYNGVVALSTIATEGFTVALSSTGIGAIAIAVGLLTTGLIALNGQMDSASADRTANWTNSSGVQSTINLSEIHKKSEKFATEQADKVLAIYQSRIQGLTYQQQLDYEKTVPGGSFGAARQLAYDAKYKSHYAYLVGIAKKEAEKLKPAGSDYAPPPVPKYEDTRLVDYLKETKKEILKLQSDYQTDMLQAQQNYADAVQSQIDDFRQSFADATNVSLGDLFLEGAQSADKLIAALKDKLTGIKQFSEDLGALSAAGYNAEFLKQVVAQGPVVGDQMAKALLGASPEAQSELQSLFKDAQDATAHGVDTLSLSIADQFNVSTKALSDAMLAAANKLNEALTNLQFNFATKTNEIGYTPVQAKGVQGVYNKIVGAQNPNGVNYNITNYVTTNATAEQIATSTVQAIKFGQPTLGVNPLVTQ